MRRYDVGLVATGDFCARSTALFEIKAAAADPELHFEEELMAALDGVPAESVEETRQEEVVTV